MCLAYALSTDVLIQSSGYNEIEESKAYSQCVNSASGLCLGLGLMS